MKLLPSFKSAKAICLAAVTIATAIVSNVSPSQSRPPTRIIQTDGQPEIVIFGSEGQSVASGCQAIRDLWKGLPTQRVGAQEYQNTISSRGGILKGHLYCNNPSKVKGYTSPVFPYPGLIVTDGKPFYVTTTAFFTALGIRPIQLNRPDGIAFMNQNRLFNNLNVTLEPNLSVLTSSISIVNKGAYVARYSISYQVNGGLKQDAFDVSFGKKAVFNLPSQASKIAIVGEYYTGLFKQKKEFFRKQMTYSDGSICYTTTGNISNPKVNDGCN
jgi:hypothetical protein